MLKDDSEFKIQKAKFKKGDPEGSVRWAVPILQKKIQQLSSLES
jgi:hypothetical protein